MNRRSNVESRTANVERRSATSFSVRRSTFAVRRSSAVFHPAQRSGLSLFEVLIALAVFMGSIAAIGQLISSGVRAAVQSRLQSQAVLRAESKMAEAVAGLIPLGGATGGFTDDASWSWTVATTPGPHDHLYLVEVTVTHAASTAIGRQSFSLRRLIRDPQMALDAYELEQEEAAAAKSGATSGSTSSTGRGSGTSSKGSK